MVRPPRPLVFGNMKNKKYQIIYADPPWRYDFAKLKRDSIEAHYNSMDLEEIKSLKVPSADNSVLYLWATAPKLREALDVMDAWGFKYKTHAIWDKGNALGLGYWFRGQHELLLVGTKGKFSPPQDTERVGSILRQPKSEHSSKPSRIRNLISEWYSNFSKLELFARKNEESLFTPNSIPWDIWGNEVKSDIEL